MRKFLLASVCAFCAVAPAQAAVNLLVNGDFESGVVGGAASGWNATTGTTSQIFVINGGAYIPCCGASGTPAALANLFATFGAGNVSNAGAVLGQTFATTIGATYNLSFDYGVMGGSGQTLSYSVASTSGPTYLAGSLFRSADNNLNTTFASNTFSFVATDTTSVVRFNVDAATISVDGILDNVSVSAAVPEPATWAMMLVGFAGLGFLRSRRRALVAA
jgi:opacity protein-like surface antigen